MLIIQRAFSNHTSVRLGRAVPLHAGGYCLIAVITTVGKAYIRVTDSVVIIAQTAACSNVAFAVAAYPIAPMCQS